MLRYEQRLRNSLKKYIQNVEIVLLKQFTFSTGVSMVVYNNYQIIKRVGDGAYGVVFKAMDSNKNNELVAIKKVNIRSWKDTMLNSEAR